MSADPPAARDRAVEIGARALWDDPRAVRRFPEVEAVVDALLAAPDVLRALASVASAGPSEASPDATHTDTDATHGIRAHRPDRESDVAAWIKRTRDAYTPQGPQWAGLDDLLDDYRLHADVGTPLTETVEGPHGEDNRG